MKDNTEDTDNKRGKSSIFFGIKNSKRKVIIIKKQNQKQNIWNKIIMRKENGKMKIRDFIWRASLEAYDCCGCKRNHNHYYENHQHCQQQSMKWNKEQRNCMLRRSSFSHFFSLLCSKTRTFIVCQWIVSNKL